MQKLVTVLKRKWWKKLRTTNFVCKYGTSNYVSKLSKYLAKKRRVICCKLRGMTYTSAKPLK